LFALTLALEAIFASLVAFFLCFFLTKYFIGYLSKKKMTVLDYHKKDKPQIPRPGGPAIIIGIVAAEVLLFAFTGSYAALGLGLVTLLSGVIGIVDDLKTLGGVAKPALLIIGGVPLVALQYLVPNAMVYNHHLYLPLFRHPTNVPLIYIMLIIVAIPVVTNTINTIDVLNGVVTGVILIASVPVGFALVLRYLVDKEHPVVLAAFLPFVAATLAFFYFHRFPSKIFPGDSGAMALGAAYGSMAIIGGVEVVAVVAILPAIMNSFFFLSSVRRLVEHRQIKSQPVVILPDNTMRATGDAKAPVTLMRLLVGSKAKTEAEIGRDILKLTAYCAFLAGLTAILTWVITFA
jgi:UDP-N-acetylmuramyl pentapeptide phosphotransferase/UDP-N-acetylglucosamine-1-phosphate transferase